MYNKCCTRFIYFTIRRQAYSTEKSCKTTVVCIITLPSRSKCNTGAPNRLFKWSVYVISNVFCDLGFFFVWDSSTALRMTASLFVWDSSTALRMTASLFVWDSSTSLHFTQNDKWGMVGYFDSWSIVSFTVFFIK